jgi:glutaredoxin
MKVELICPNDGGCGADLFVIANNREEVPHICPYCGYDGLYLHVKEVDYIDVEVNE